MGEAMQTLWPVNERCFSFDFLKLLQHVRCCFFSLLFLFLEVMPEGSFFLVLFILKSVFT